MATKKPRLSDGLVLSEDNQVRCWWPGTDPLYVAYHDEEWGIPQFDDRALFEKLILDGFQAGLSWITILRKRNNFRKAFADFEPEKIARFTKPKIEALMRDEGIIRNRAKIESSVTSARSWIELQERGGFSKFLWGFVDGRPIQSDLRRRSEMPAATELSTQISIALKAEGFNFVGPTIVYAFMQAVGMVNDHLIGCHCHSQCAAIANKL